MEYISDKEFIPSISELIDLSHTRAHVLLAKAKHPWDILSQTERLILSLGASLDSDVYRHVSKNVWIAKNAAVAPSALICGPAIIGEKTEIRHCAYIRGGVIVGDGAVIGNSCELKNSVISDEVHLPHYNYVGDSVLGYKAHLGAGAIISNLRLDGKSIVLRSDGAEIETGLRKIGAFIGDCCEIGAGCVIYPGTVIGKRSLSYPLTGIRGVIPPDTVIKTDGKMLRRIF